MDPSGDGDSADKVNYSHLLEVVDSLEPREVQNSESAMKVGSSGDTPGTRDVRAGEERGSVVRNVIDDVVDDLLGKAYVALLAHPENSLHLPGEVSAAKPKHARRLLGVYNRCGNRYVNNAYVNIHETMALPEYMARTLLRGPG